MPEKDPIWKKHHQRRSGKSVLRRRLNDRNPNVKRRAVPRHAKHVIKLIEQIEDLNRAEKRGVMFEVVLALAKQGRPYEQLYAKLLLSALAYCDESLKRFEHEMRRLGLVVMHRKGEEGRWMRDAIDEGKGKFDHVRSEDDYAASHTAWRDPRDDDDSEYAVG